MAMKKAKKSPETLAPQPQPLYHILLGEPDDNCEICKAHALEGTKPGVTTMQVTPLPLEQILECDCPLCAQFKTDPKETP